MKRIHIERLLLCLACVTSAVVSTGCGDGPGEKRSERIIAEFRKEAWFVTGYNEYPPRLSRSWVKLCKQMASLGPEAVPAMLEISRKRPSGPGVLMVPEATIAVFAPLRYMTAEDKQKGLKALLDLEPGAFRSYAAVYILWNLIQTPDPRDLDFVLSVAEFPEYHASRYALYCLGFYKGPEARKVVLHYLSAWSRHKIWAAAAAVNMADPALKKRLEDRARLGSYLSAALAGEAVAKISRQEGVALLTDQLHKEVERGEDIWPVLDALCRLREFGEWQYVARVLPKLTAEEYPDRLAALRYLQDAPFDEAHEAAKSLKTQKDQLMWTPGCRFFEPQDAGGDGSYRLMLRPIWFWCQTARLAWEGVSKPDE